MKNLLPHSPPQRPDPRQVRKNRRLALGLALFALLVFVTSMLRQWMLSNG